MPEPMLHISSAIVRVGPGVSDRVASEIAALGGEVVLAERGRLIVIIEGSSSGKVGEILTRITLIEGVHSACMVYEQAEPLCTMGEAACP